MAGSEPSSSGLGWNYTYWLTALADNPAMNGAAVGQAICDGAMGVYESEEGAGLAGEVNAFSVINLNKMPALRKAYEKYFGGAKNLGGVFARAASSRYTERYSDCYVDLGTLAENTKDILPEASENLLNAIHDAVSYNRPGSYLSAQGISTYYPYVTMDKPFSQEEFDNFLAQKTTPSSQKNLYKKLLNLDVLNLSGVPVVENEDGNIATQLTPKQLKNVSAVRSIIMPYIEYGDESVGLEDEGAIILSSDIDLNIDWQTGTFTENFQGNWPTIDGHKILMKLSVEGSLRDFYQVPILLSYEQELEGQQDEQGNPIKIPHENEPVTLQIAFDFSSNTYEVFGVGSSVENGMMRDRSIELKPGNVITPIFLSIVPEDSLDATSGNVMQYTNPQTGKSIIYKVTFGESFTYTEKSAIEFQPFEAGDYFYFFQFIAPNGTAAYSWPAVITIDEYGGITKTIPTPEDLMQTTEE